MNRKTVLYDQDSTSVDLTPMLDVVFIMLIFFIVTAAFIRESGLDVPLPPSTDVTSESQSIVFKVTANNEIWLNGRVIDIRSVRSNVERFRAENPLASVVINADPLAKTKIYSEIADQAYLAKVSGVALNLSDEN